MSDFKNWVSYRLGDVAPATSNSLPSPTTTVWNLSLEDVEANTGKILSRTQCLVNELGSSKCSFDTRHVLYSKLRPYLNKVVLPDEPGVGTSELIPMLPDCNRIDREYLAYYLRSPVFVDFAKANTRGANLPRIAMSELWNHSVPVPLSLDEQRRIVGQIKRCLERAGEVLTITDEQSVAQQFILRSARRELFGAPAVLPSQWTECRLDELASVIYGISEAISNNKNPELGPPIVRMANISIEGDLDLSDLRYCPIPKGKEDHFVLKPGDLLLNWRSGSASHIGKTAIFEEEGRFTCASFILRIRAYPDKANNRYLKHLLNYMRAEGVFTGSSRMQINHKLNAAEFSAFKVRIPPSLEVQEVIADKLDAVEALSRQCRFEILEKKSQAVELRDAILRKAFAGEL